MSRYEDALHAMQSGVAYEMELRPEPTSPKHLRVGVNASMVEHSALAGLLLKKGIISHEEYIEAITKGMEAEALRYEKHLSELTGAKVTLR